MFLKVKSKQGVWAFSASVALTCALATVLIDLVSWSFAPPIDLVVFGALGAALLSFPIAAVIGAQMLAMHARSIALEHAARFDSLTGALTRDAFLIRARELSVRGGVLIIVDIDDFKMFNDRHGHLAGDAALRQVAQKLIRCSREQDIVARFGGEEFLILLPDTTLSEGERLAGELCIMLRQTPVVVHGKPMIVTASFGVSPLGPAEPVENALSRADGALYKAKRSGRDMVCIAA